MKTNLFEAFENGVYTALERYSNVHRGSGHKSRISTRLYEEARTIVLEYLGLKKGARQVIFCSPRRAEALTALIQPGKYTLLSSQDIGLALGVRAIVVRKKHLPKGNPLETGGGTTRLIAEDYVVWAKAPDRYEAGTPAVMNVIAFAKALRLLKQSRANRLNEADGQQLSPADLLHQDAYTEFTGPALLDKLRSSVIGKDLVVPTSSGQQPFINLDSSASTPTFSPVWETFRQTLQLSDSNKDELIAAVRQITADALGAPKDHYETIFTSNTTEAINLAAQSFCRYQEAGTAPVIISTLLEHSSNDLPWRLLPNHSQITLGIDDSGFINFTELKTLLKEYNEQHIHGPKRITLLAMSGASNVLGSCNDLKAISRLVHEYGAQLFVDGAQLVAHQKINMQETNIDYLAFSAHKVYAPFGSGALLGRKEMLHFTDEELVQLHRSGEENVAGIAAMGKALVLLQRVGMDTIREEEKKITQYALKQLALVPRLKIYGMHGSDDPKIDQRLGVFVFEIKGIISFKVGKQLSQMRGIGVRVGCHCAHILVKHLYKVGPGLKRFQRIIATLIPKIEFPGMVRISLGIENTEADIDVLVEVLQHIAAQPKDQKTNIKKQIESFIEESSLRVYA